MLSCWIGAISCLNGVDESAWEASFATGADSCFTESCCFALDLTTETSCVVVVVEVSECAGCSFVSANLKVAKALLVTLRSVLHAVGAGFGETNTYRSSTTSVVGAWSQASELTCFDWVLSALKTFLARYRSAARLELTSCR